MIYMHANVINQLYGMSCSLHMGTRKRITYKKFHFLFFLMLFSCIHKPDVGSLLHFSLFLALQRSNEIYKTIRMNHPPTYKLAPYSKNTYFTHSLISFIFAIDLVLWTFTLILLSGDIEVNPGPNSVVSNNDSNRTISAS